MHPVLVTGATGRIGRLVVNELLASGLSVRALTRRTAAETEFPPEVEVISGDLTMPDSLEPALKGVGAVFLLWTAPQASAEHVIARLATHAEHVVFLSSPHQTPHPFFQQPNPMADLHAGLERLIASADIPSTIIRPGMFASNTVHWWGSQIKKNGAVRWPYGDVETAPIDERDIARVATRALSEEGHAGGDYVLTGPESLSQSEQVRIIGDAIGRRVRFEELSPEEFRLETATTWPPRIVDMLLDAWKASLGHPAFVTQTVADITGSPARTFHQWAADHQAAFRTP